MSASNQGSGRPDPTVIIISGWGHSAAPPQSTGHECALEDDPTYCAVMVKYPVQNFSRQTRQAFITFWGKDVVKGCLSVTRRTYGDVTLILAKPPLAIAVAAVALCALVLLLTVGLPGGTMTSSFDSSSAKSSVLREDTLVLPGAEAGGSLSVKAKGMVVPSGSLCSGKRASPA